MAQVPHESNDNGRRFTFSISIGLKKLTNKFTHPAPKLAHLASTLLNPIDSKILTE